MHQQRQLQWASLQVPVQDGVRRDMKQQWCWVPRRCRQQGMTGGCMNSRSASERLRLIDCHHRTHHLTCASPGTHEAKVRADGGGTSACTCTEPASCRAKLASSASMSSSPPCVRQCAHNQCAQRLRLCAQRPPRQGVPGLPAQHGDAPCPHFSVFCVLSWLHLDPVRGRGWAVR